MRGGEGEEGGKEGRGKEKRWEGERWQGEEKGESGSRNLEMCYTASWY